MVQLFQLVDDNSNKQLSIEEFFEIVDLIERNDQLSPFLIRTLDSWDSLRKFLNKNCIHLNLYITVKVD